MSDRWTFGALLLCLIGALCVAAIFLADSSFDNPDGGLPVSIPYLGVSLFVTGTSLATWRKPRFGLLLLIVPLLLATAVLFHANVQINERCPTEPGYCL